MKIFVVDSFVVKRFCGDIVGGKVDNYFLHSDRRRLLRTSLILYFTKTKSEIVGVLGGMGISGWCDV